MLLHADDVRPEDMELLPTFMRDVARLCGLEPACRLAALLGGLDFPVPKGEANNRAGMRRFAVLAEAMGEGAARIFCTEYGGERVFIPFCRSVIRRIRDRAIVREFDAGATVGDLVLRHKLSYRQIEKILKRPIAL